MRRRDHSPCSPRLAWQSFLTAASQIVVPAKAGIHSGLQRPQKWIHAFAGMTSGGAGMPVARPDERRLRRDALSLAGMSRSTHAVE